MPSVKTSFHPVKVEGKGRGTARCRYRGSIGVARRVAIHYSGQMARRKETATGWVEQEAGQGECDVKKIQVEAETLRKKADLLGWDEEKEHANEEARVRNATQRAIQIVVNKYVLWHSLASSVLNKMRGRATQECDAVHLRLYQLDSKYTLPPGLETRALSRRSHSSPNTTAKAPHSKLQQEGSYTTSS